MIGDAVPIRFSRRIKRKVSLLPVRVSPKRKIRLSAVEKRASSVNSSLIKAFEKTKVDEKNKLEENPKLASQIFKRASCNLKPVTRKSPRLGIHEIYDKKRKTRNSFKTSQVNLTNNKKSLKNLELFDNSKKAIEKKNHKKFVNEEKQSVRKSLRLSKSSPKEKGKNKELTDSDLKPLKKTRHCQKKSTKQVTILSSESVFTPNPEKCAHTPKLSERKKSARLSTEPLNQEISVHTPASKSLAVTPNPRKVTRISTHSGNRKSGRLSKEPRRLGKMNSDISLYTSSFLSLLETPQPGKHSEKRKSSRLLEPSPLRIFNKELPLSTPASRNPDSTLNKSSKSCKSIELLSPESRSRKLSKPKVSNKDGSSVSHEKRKQKRQVSRHQKTSENFKKPLSNETENLPFDILTTPAFEPPCGRSLSKKYLSKSDSKSSKRKLNTSTSENRVASGELQDAKKRRYKTDFPKIPSKGSLKRKRWLLNNLKEKNGSYEDDIFENRNFDLYKPAFHFGDESDGSSVNIATPKFDCILTPALPQKTPCFKDCISPTEFLQARKTAEEYMYRRNKKRKSKDRPSSSGKKTSVNKKNTVQEIPEKKKLDFEEAVTKLIAVQKNLEIEAEVDDEVEDSYFSDASN